MALFIGFLKILRGKTKTYFDDDILEEELLKYIVPNKKKIDYRVIKKFINKLTALKVLLEYEIKIQEIKGLKFEEEEQVKKELKELEESLNCERVWRKIWGNDFNINDQVKLREKASERISKTEKLRRKRKIDLRNLFDIDNRAIDLLMELDIDKKDRQEELILIEVKLEKLKISEKTIRQLDYNTEINYVNLLSLVFLIIRFIIKR